MYQWAMVIRNEIGNVQNGLEKITSNLEATIKRAECDHPSAKKAKEEAGKILGNK